MEFTGALQAVVDGYRSRTDEVLAVYFLSPAVGQVARVVVLTGLALVYAYLAVTGRLARFRADLRAADTDPPGEGADVAAYERWLQDVLQPFEHLVTPEVLVGLAATLVVTVAVYVGLRAVATAAQLSACWATMHDDRATVAAIAGAGRHWRPLLGVQLLRGLLVLAVTVAAFAPLVLVATRAPLAAVLLAIPVFFAWLVVVVAVRAVFAFAAVAVVVEDAGVTESLADGLGFARANTRWVLGYLVTALGVYSFVGSVAATGGAGSGAVSGLMGLVVAAPVLDLLKTALYGDHAAAIAPPAAPDRSLLDQLRGGLRRGVDALRTFVASQPGVHLVAAATLLAGGVAGWLLAGPYEGLVTTSIQARLADHSPRTAPVAFTTNNVAVAVTTAFSGLGFGLPTVGALLFNGALLGAVARLEVAPVVLVAFIVPHGLLELPAFVVAGALGFALGATAWRTHRGRLGRPALAAALERGFWILVGVAVVLAAAGLLEGLVSPYYWRPFLAG